MTDISLSRRRLLAAGVGAVAVGALSACSAQTAKVGSGERGSGVALPTYTKFSAVKPDLPGDAAGVPDGFYAYPRPPVATSKGKPASSKTMTAMFGATVAAPSPMSKSHWWADLNDRLGTTFEAQITPSGDYPAKLASAIAGGQMPDLVQLQGVSRLPDVLKAKFHDLTDFLAGDKINDYPNLANLATVTWKTCVYDQRIMAVPPQNIVGTGTWCMRKDVFTKLGIEFNPTSPQEILNACAQVTDPKAARYALSSVDQVLLGLGCTMWNAPNGWAENGGKFTLMQETDEFKQALDWTTKMWKAGVIHPDAFGNINGPGLFMSANVALISWGGVGWTGLLTAGIKDLDLGFYTAPTAEGGGVGVKRLGTGTYQLCGISKQKSDDRVREILRVVDYLSSPFGTAEYLSNTYGIEGVDFNWDDKTSTPIKTPVGAAEVTGEFAYVSCAPYMIYTPGHKELTDAFYQLQKATIPGGRADPSAILYSDTNDQQGANLQTKLTDVTHQVVQGRKSMADFDAAVATWRSAGGDKIRNEFEAAFAAAHAG